MFKGIDLINFINPAYYTKTGADSNKITKIINPSVGYLKIIESSFIHMYNI